MPKKVFTFLISITVLPFAIFSINRYLENPIGNTTISWIVQFIIIAIFLVARFIYFNPINNRHFNFVNWYLIWVVISLLRGIFIAEIYWDYKALIGNTFTLLIPLIAYVVTDNEKLQSMMSYFVKIALPLSIVFFINLDIGTWAWYLYPISFLMFFFPILQSRWKLTIFIITLVCILGDITTRSSVIKYSIPVLILFFYYFRFFIRSEWIIKIARKVFFIAPWIFFILGVSGIFNVLNFKDYLNWSYTPEAKEKERRQDLLSDSRTFIYREVLQSAIKHNYWFLGHSPARGNETVVFGEEKEDITGRPERLRNEANIPNVFTWMGVIGVVLYFMVFYKASFLAINKSNNIFSKLIGLYIAFRWMYAWVEDYYNFDINNLVIWIMLGVCFSTTFREMNNLEVNLWVRGIFNKNYARAFRIYEMKKI